MVVAQTLVENLALLPKPASTFLVHKAGNDNKCFLCVTKINKFSTGYNQTI